MEGLLSLEADVVAIEKAFGALRVEDRVRLHEVGNGGSVRECHDEEEHVLNKSRCLLRDHLDGTVSHSGRHTNATKASAHHSLCCGMRSERMFGSAQGLGAREMREKRKRIAFIKLSLAWAYVNGTKAGWDKGT